MSNETGKQPAMHKKHVARLERERKQSRIILYSFIGILVAVVLLLGYGYLDVKYLQLQRPVAKIKGAEITLAEFQARVRLQRRQLLIQYSQIESLYMQYQQFAQSTGMDLSQQMQQFTDQAQEIQFQLDSPELLGQTVLDQMINEEIIRQEAAARGITVREEELNAKIQADFGYFPNGTPTATVTPTLNPLLEIPPLTPSKTPAPTMTFTPDPAATIEPSPTATMQPTATSVVTPEATSTPLPTATPYTQEGFEQLYKETSENLAKLGFEYDIYKKLYTVQILQQKLQEVIGVDAKPEEEQVHARHILVSDPALAQGLIERLKNGENFGALAAEYSVDTSNALDGGDLGWFGKGQMVPEFEAAAYALQTPGEFTLEPVQSQFGSHIIQLIERPYSPEMLKAARDQAFADWIAKTKEEYQVETFDLWRTNIPTDPNTASMATEAAEAQQTALAKDKEQ